ncbi:multiple C2 and transmembrane domain-containing protein 1-like isoform X4 [Ruditapes philippinarum]|uniref:multiple C2 and transmembrane domain-containing protein 1-like isoform X4 n=1 Tax=Ruditapes philippinarum TaxID=129788 RepID=UPI00295BE40C|nr:multiple C2 and transmembrane domain-containing protein 1-like isoform X4 [Ruditapes philippinarum]
MATSEDLLNKLFVSPLDSIGRKLRSGRRRHTTDVVPGLSFRSAKNEQSHPVLPKSRHTSVDFGSSVIPVEVVHDTEESSTSAISNRHVLMQHPFHSLEVWLQEGRDLVIRDSCGTSDPYVKFKLGSKQLYKSRTVLKNLNPKWDERFVLSIEDVFRPILLSVYDYDRGRFDDSMGSAELNLENLKPNEPTDLELKLSDKGKSDYMGVIKLQVTLVPKSQEDRDQYFKRTVKLTDKESAARKLKMQMWTGVVTIVLVEGRDLIPMDDNGLSDPYVKFKLGNEKYRSKHKYKTLNPRWLEQFDLRLYQGQTSHLEIVMYDHDVGRDDFMGRAVIDLSKLERERTHVIEQQLEDGAGILKLLITISGTSGHETISDLSAYAFNPMEREEIVRKFGFFKSFQSMKDIGWLQVKVFKAQDLLAADLGGKSDPFCVLELVNTRLQTHTEYKTLNPEWNKLFTFNVKDIHSVLELTVYDEDRDKKVEFLGRCAIPLLRIKPGEKRWYALKDKKLIHRTKGAILIEIDFVYNHFKAAVRTVNPKEEKYMQPEPKFKISIMKKNIDRVSQIISTFIDGGKFVQSCFNWDSPIRSLTAFLVFLVLVWNFEPYMLPLTLLILLLKNVLLSSIVSPYSKDPEETEYEDDDDDFDEEEDREKEEKKSFKEKLQAAQEICLQVQEGLDIVASLGERVKNTFTWSVPWLTTLAVIVLGLGVIILYHIPVRWLILAWGINKFTKKLRAPNAIPNNEVLDFLSRVPSDKELVQYRELRPDINTVPSRKKTR